MAIRVLKGMPLSVKLMATTIALLPIRSRSQRHKPGLDP